jgi:hypothetical protein
MGLGYRLPTEERIVTEISPTVWSARVLALVLVLGVGWVLLGMVRQELHGPQRVIWIEPGQYRGPGIDKLDPAEIETIDTRTQHQNY